MIKHSPFVSLIAPFAAFAALLTLAGCRHDESPAPLPIAQATPDKATPPPDAPAPAAGQPPSAPGQPSPGPSQPAPGAPARFVDVAQAAGITYKWVVAGKRPLNVLQTIGNGCAFLDYDNSDNLSVLLVGDKLALYKGDGHGHFTDVTHEMGLDKLKGHFLGAAVGDYDNDGYDDLYLTAYRGGTLLHNEKGKGFKDVTAQAGIKPQPWGTSAAFADVDGSGRLSLFIGNYAIFGPHTDPQLCDMSGHKTACGPRYYQPEHGTLYRNLGGGKFQDITKAWGADHTSGKDLGVAFADYDGSGRQSLALANDEVAGNLLQNKGGKFSDVAVTAGTAYDANGNAHGGMGTDWGDYDNDGKLDLAVATFQSEQKCIYHNEGKDIFDDDSSSLGIGQTPYVSFGEKWMDFNNDGWLDLIIANGHVQDNIADIDKTVTYREPTQLDRNDGGTHFTDLSASAGPDLQRPLVGRGLAIGDFDNDGRVDVLVVDSEGAPLLLHNESSPVGHWLTLRLVGTKSDRDGYGAVVTFQAGGRKMVRLCHSDGSYMSASDKRVHAGLGDATQADVITIHWPSGHVDTLKNVAADHILTVREGQGIVH